jgi:AraC-like DNA-binding protein
MDFGSIKTLTSVSSQLVTYILEGLSFSELEKRQLLERTGLSWEGVHDFKGRISIMAMARFWNEVLAVTGDEFAGLEIGLNVPADRFGLAVHAAENSEDYRQCLQRYTKFVKLINNLIRCDLRENDEYARLSMKYLWNVFDLERHAVDIGFACIKAWGTSNVPGFKIRGVHLRHSLSSAKERYEKIFKAPVFFSAKTSELVFDRAILDAKISASKPELGVILEHYASAELASVPDLTNFPARVSQIILAELRAARPVSLAMVSRELKTGERQLQRKLQESCTSFSLLVDEVRRSLAPELLPKPESNVEQVGFQLGYAEPSAFIRAFKKWYGVTPGEFRRSRP